MVSSIKISVFWRIDQISRAPGIDWKNQTCYVEKMKIQKQYRYTIFNTNWGWFGLLSSEKGLARTCLPTEDKNEVERTLLAGIDEPILDKKAFSSIENEIMTYYAGRQPVFSDIEVDIEDLTLFERTVLTALRDISYGKTVTYGRLAQIAGSPKAARAIGACMAKNPLPLIIPCHRVLGSNGDVTGFSAPGGIQTKLRMLKLEKA